ncbi:MAG: TIGR02530 family flagellar biosynthesis protein [Oscillospiraceae bacterium]
MAVIIPRGRFSVPITTGNVEVSKKQQSQSINTTNSGESFGEIMRQQLLNNSNVQFSKHAVNRVYERNIDITDDKMKRLDDGIKLAQGKGLISPLILVGTTAFVVNVPNNRVITTLNGDDLKGNVFTNIDGTVII